MPIGSSTIDIYKIIRMSGIMGMTLEMLRGN